MSKQPDMSWKAIGYLWIGVLVLGFFAWLTTLDNGMPEKAEPSDPKYLVTQLGQGSSFLCPTENMVLRIEESIESRNKAKMDMLVEQGCFGAEANVKVTFISGSLSNNTRKVLYQGRTLWAYGETVGSQTAAEIKVVADWIECTNQPEYKSNSMMCQELFLRIKQ